MVSSTFTRNYSLALNEEVVQELKRISEVGKWHFDVVLHPLLSEEAVNTFKAIQNENLKYHDTTDLIPLFKRSDVMLSDTSSALIEYLLQIKPVVTFRNNMPLPSYMDVKEVSDIEKTIALALTRPANIIKEIEEYAAMSHPYRDGKSSVRVIDVVLEFLEKDKSYLKKKPLDLIRKYKIRKKLGFYTLKSYRKPISLRVSSQDFARNNSVPAKTQEENKISAVFITYNEEVNIEEVLKNVSFVDEIIVVDSFSTDNTVKLIQQHPKVKLIQRPFVDFTDQKAFAMDQAANDWILFMDADERLTPLLKDEILEVVGSRNPSDAYYFYRTFMFQKEVLKYSGWQSDKNFRLFRKSKVAFTNDRIVHETLVVNGKVDVLKNKLIHYSYKDYDEYKHKMIKYGKMKAAEEIHKNYDPNLYHFLFRPAYKFFNHYVLRLGFLDGKKGIIISYLNALGVYARYQELKRLRKMQKKQ